MLPSEKPGPLKKGFENSGGLSKMFNMVFQGHVNLNFIGGPIQAIINLISYRDLYTEAWRLSLYIFSGLLVVFQSLSVRRCLKFNNISLTISSLFLLEQVWAGADPESYLWPQGPRKYFTIEINFSLRISFQQQGRGFWIPS